MNRFQLWGVGGFAAAITVALVIVPSSANSSVTPGVAPPAAVAEVPAASIEQAAPADEEDPESVEAPPPNVVAITDAPFGRKLVDRSTQTLYVFSLDPPGESACVGMCARTWLPARSYSGKPQPGSGVEAPSVGNIQRPDGSEQMTYNGHPVYYYAGDSAPGQSNGNGRSEFGGQWSAQPPARAEGPR